MSLSSSTHHPMKITCPHCSQKLELDPETLTALEGSSHFHCPACSEAVEVPAPVLVPANQAAPGQGKRRKSKRVALQTQQGKNRNMLVLGVVALLTIGGVALFLASKNGGNIFNTFQNVTNQIINNSYFTQLIADGVTTKENLEAIAEIRPYGDGFIGISKEEMDWEQGMELAGHTGSQILAVNAGPQEELSEWLNETFGAKLATTAWVREQGTGAVLAGSEILDSKELNRQRLTLLHWQPDTTPESNLNRAVAEWALSKGAYVWVTGSEDRITQASELPVGNLEIEKLVLWDGNKIVFEPKLEAQDMLRFRNLKRLKDLMLRSHPIGDEGLKILSDIPSLTALNVHACKVSDEGLVHLAKLTNLEKLDVGYSNGRITDDGAAHLLKLTKLKWLCIYDSGITDKTLVEVISKLPSLDYVELTTTKITPAGEQAFKQAKPLCHVFK